jgi:hypothetical protein
MSTQDQAENRPSARRRWRKLLIIVASCLVISAGVAWPFRSTLKRVARVALERVHVLKPPRSRPVVVDIPADNWDEIKPNNVVLTQRIDYSATDWPEWRGADGSNAASAADCPTTWGPTENVKWIARIPGRGHSTPVIVDERLFLISATDSPIQMLALAFDRNSGQELWRQQLHEGGVRSIHENNSHASSTPVADKQNVYVAFLFDNFIHVSALDQRAGHRAWTARCGPCTADWGFAASLALWRGLIFVQADNAESGWLAAVEASDGKIAWRRQRPAADRGSYSSPLVANLNGQEQVVTQGGGEVAAYEPSSGATLWSYQGIPSSCAASPTVGDDLCFASGGWPGRKLVCLRIGKPDAQGKIVPEVVWTLDKAGEVPYVPSPLYHAGKLYLVHDQGVTTCRDATSGKVSWKRRLAGNFWASPTLVGDHVVVVNDAGTAYLLDPANGKIVVENTLPEGAHASPVPVGADLYLRVTGALYSIKAP